MKQRFKILKTRINEFFCIGKYYSFSYAFWGLVWWSCFYFRTPFSFKISKFAIIKKTRWLDRYIEKNYCNIIDKYKYYDLNTQKITDDFKIWVFWGQGEDNMPPLVKSCYRQLCNYNDNVILISNENLLNYIDIQETVLEKVRTGKISWANFSDIVRNLLLAKYGGMWLDATVWTSDNLLLAEIERHPFYTANGDVKITSKSVCFWTSLGLNWSSWCISSKFRNYILFSFVGEMMNEFAIKEEFWPDYVFQDFLYYYAFNKFSIAANDIKNISIHNLKRNKLATIMNEPYDEKFYKELIDTDFLFKLSYKANWKEKDSNGNTTFYGFLLSKS